ncbi:MAG: AMP-dependent synthetase/ligase [Sandaracinaceae bacterium]
MPSSFEPKFATLLDIYRASVRRFADRPLFGTKAGGAWTWLTYRQFAEQTDELRAGLASIGLERGDRVGIIANNRPEWAIGAYATYGLGAAFVPMYESQLPKEWAYILRDCAAKVVLVANDEIRATIEGLRGEIPTLEHVVLIAGDGSDLTFEELRRRGRSTPVDLADVARDEVAGLIYTSGTTGNPKGVKLSHANLANNVSAMHEVFPMDAEDRSLSFLPWAHSFGQTAELHMLFSMGASLGIAESVSTILENLAEVKPTLLFSVPRIFNRIYDGVMRKIEEGGGLRKQLFMSALQVAEERRALAEQHKRSGLVDLKHGVLDRLVFRTVRGRFGGRLKYAFSGGAAISKEVAEFIDSLGITVYEGYGLTETSPIATANWPGARKIGSVGQAIPGVRIEIDHDITEDPKNGEVIIHGHNVMLGYHNLDEENAKVFTKDGGFRSGDMGYLDEDGFLYITGRIKEQYKLENGKYVVPAPLEEQLQISPFITTAFINGQNKPYNVALIVPDMPTVRAWATERGLNGSDEELLDRPEVRGLYQAELDRQSSGFKGYERVKAFGFLQEDFTVENGLLTPKLSVKRRKVMERFGDRLEHLYR